MTVPFGGLRFEPETWILERLEDEETMRVYDGLSKRRSEESALRLVVDSSGLKTFRQVGMMGVEEATRSGT